VKVAVIGGGAAGFFSALSVKTHFPDVEVVIFEKSSKVLSKVKISGGGRCNVTHACFDNKLLAGHYPRGGRFLQKLFYQFDANSTIEWFKDRGILMKTYPDGCIFPLSNDSQTIINCFTNEAQKKGVKIITLAPVSALEKINESFNLKINDTYSTFDRVIVTTGGHPKKSNLVWLENLGLEIVDPVPSLFTFNMPSEAVTSLMGNVVNEVTVRIEGEKRMGKGPLLITHWGMSGPAILELSAWGARLLNEKNYNFYILVNWLYETSEHELRTKLDDIQSINLNKKMVNVNPFPITNKIWNYLIEKSGIHADAKWSEFNGKLKNKLVNNLLNDRYSVSGKTTFKEEFVTAGGIALNEINPQTMESKKIPGLFFSGEVLDIDGVTGGFNFQAAWTTAFVAGKHINGN
jgi:predicted Rossmann fold flavoprotein